MGRGNAGCEGRAPASVCAGSRSASWEFPQRRSEKRGKLKTICENLNGTNRGKRGLFGTARGDGIGAAAGTGNVQNPAWQQGKVNLGEQPRLPRQLGWAARPGDSPNSLNRVIRKHRAGFIRKHRAGCAPLPAHGTALRTQLVISISLPRARHAWICLAASARASLPDLGAHGEPPGLRQRWHRTGEGRRCHRAPGAQRGRGKAEVTAVA